MAATFAEIEKIKINGPSETDLNKVKETWKQQYLVNIKDNSFWARQLLHSVETGTDLAELLNYEKQVDSLTPKEIRDVANKYFDMKNYAQFILDPEK
jgi:zinc protease